ncbi:immunity 49 family protein [Streptomyces sp. NPDC056121]|uniref:immunity 49 family protein n=1 Tax=unclassified Streptomyces TaxID=2593676 RepID=UPI0035D7821C
MNLHHVPDPHLPMLNVPQAERLRSLTAAHFLARHGTQMTVTGDAVRLEGRLSPLSNLAQRCRQSAEDDWPRIVEQHFVALENSSQGGESATELLERTCWRLLPDDAFEGDTADGFRYARPVAEGLLAALALDAPTSVRILDDRDVARVGAEQLWAAGRANLIREPVEHSEFRGPQGALMHSVYGDSFFVSSKALVLPDLVRELTGRELPEAGALVVMPTRHLLAFHPIVDGSVVDAVNDLGSYAIGAYEDGPGALSPRLYWWHQGRLVSLTAFDHEKRSFSVVPPQELMDLMRSLRGQDSAGAAPEPTPPTQTADELALTTTQLTARLPQSPAVFGEAFAASLALSHVRCASDPDGGALETWEAWVGAMQVGSALFATTTSRESSVACRIGHDVVTLPVTGPAPYADGRAWLNAFYLAVVCRERDRTTRLCHVPLDDLRRAAPMDEYVFHWIDTLQTYWLQRPMDDVVQKLLATMNTSHPDVATRTPADFLNLVDYQPVALFHRLVTGDREAFAEALTEALAHHERYWSDSTGPHSRVALGPLALACLAFDSEFPVDSKSPYLPTCLLNRAWYGEFDT